ncbi:MAG: peptidoglycan editing factor PgeF [Desulfamplus sp.]|nr:peptidoglycan editing factor PgeF [Desulfamplus sp.]
MFLNQSTNGVQYYSFNSLSKFSNSLVHGVFTRVGGVSNIHFSSLNVGLATGDDKEKVYLNRKIVAKSMGANEDSSIYLNQVHGDDFLILKKDDNKLNNYHTSNSYIGFESPKNADGIVTNIEGLLTVMQVADCQAIILYDPVNQVIANIHSGWRGTLLNIVGRGVDIMVEQFYTKPYEILAAISPSLGPCCAEFRNYREEIPEDFWKYRVKEIGNGYNFDFWKISHDQLAEKGVLSEHIEIAEVCTPCTSNIFYSYRKEGLTGRFAVAAGLI